MLFGNLRASAALKLEDYSDVDHFHQSEQYAQAESIPLAAGHFSVLRASLTLPSCTLSLVRTFPRIVNGYDVSGRLLVVVPMDGIQSTRLNGKTIGQSLILIRGKANCTVVEPEGRLVAIFSMRPAALDPMRADCGDGHLLLRLPPAELSRLQSLIRTTLEFAASEPAAISAADVPSTVQDSLLFALGHAMRSLAVQDCDSPAALARYKSIIDRVDQLIRLNPLDSATEVLAEEMGISVRTLQTASQSVCGLAAHRYNRLRRMWLVRRQLRTGAAGLTVKGSALAHGFWHMSQFAKSYHASFGELPSVTLARARFGSGAYPDGIRD